MSTSSHHLQNGMLINETALYRPLVYGLPLCFHYPVLVHIRNQSSNSLTTRFPASYAGSMDLIFLPLVLCAEYQRGWFTPHARETSVSPIPFHAPIFRALNQKHAPLNVNEQYPTAPSANNHLELLLFFILLLASTVYQLLD